MLAALSASTTGSSGERGDEARDNLAVEPVEADGGAEPGAPNAPGLPRVSLGRSGVKFAVASALGAFRTAARSALMAARRAPDPAVRTLRPRLGYRIYPGVWYPAPMTEHADLAANLCSEATRAADRIDEATDPAQVASLAKSGQIRATAAVAAALLDVAAAIRGGGSPWHGGR
jgi:hypothetical protein